MAFVCASDSSIVCSQLQCSASATSSVGSGFFSLLDSTATLRQLSNTNNRVYDPARNSWSTSVILRLQVTDDTVVQPVRVVSVNVSCSLGGSTASLSATVAVYDDDVTPNDVEFAQPSVTAAEGTTANIVVSKTSGPSQSQAGLTVTYRVTLGTASLADTGLSTSTGTVMIPAASISSLISIPITDDELREGDETFTVELVSVSPSTYGRVGSQSSVQVTIPASDQSLEVFEFAAASTDVTASKGDTVTFTVSRLQLTAGGTTLRWSVVDLSTGGAASVTDLTPVTGTISFSPGASSAQFSVSVQQDSVAEPRQTFRVDLSVVSTMPGHPAAISTAAGSATLTVRASGYASGALGVDPSSMSVTGSEQGALGHVSIDILREGGSSGPVVARWRIASSLSTEHITASQTDFGLQQGVFAMLDGESEVTVTIQINDDTIPEPDEVYYFVIWLVTGGDAVIDSSRRYARLTITESDDPNGVFGFASPRVYARELSTNNPVALTTVRSRGAFGLAAVHWRVVNAATHGGDVSATSGTLQFSSLQTVQSLVLAVLPDDIPEADEEVVVELTSVDGGGRINATAAQCTIVISANDDAVAFEVGSLAVDEGQDAVIAVERTGSALGEVTVEYSVSSGTAQMGADFLSPATGNVTIAAGATSAEIRIPIVDDTTAEGPESFTVTLTGIAPGGDAVVGLPSSLTVTIGSNDGASGVFGFVGASASVYPIREGTTYTFTVARNLTDIYGTGIALVPATLSWVLRPVGSVQRDPATDFAQTGGVLSFSAGVMTLPLTLEVRNDTTPEVLHAYTLSLVSPSADGRLCTVPCGAQRRIVTVPANNDPHGVFSFAGGTSVGAATVDLAGGASRTVTATLTRAGGAIGDVDAVVQAWFNGSAAVFANNVAVARFSAGETSKTVRFVVRDTEPLFVGGLFSLSLQAVSVTGTYGDIPESGTASIAAPRTATVTATASDVAGVLSLVGGPLVLQEPDAGVANYTLGVTRTGGVFGPVTVRWIITSPTPPANTIDDNDFVTRSGTVELAHLQASAPAGVVISVRADTLPEFNESFGVTLIQVEEGLASIDQAAASVSGVILENDDPYGTVQFANANVSGAESDGVIRVNIVRSNGGLATSLWTWRLSAGASGVDPASQFVSVTGTVRLNTGDLSAAIFLLPIDDTVPELPQDFNLTIEALNAREDLGPLSTCVVTILASDDAYGLFGFVDAGEYTVMEGTGEDTVVTLPLNRARGVFGRTTVAYTVTRLPGSSGAVGDDILPVTGTVVFEDGQNASAVTLRVQQDTLLEDAESFDVALSIASGSQGRVLPAFRRRTVTVLHNDDPIQFGPDSRPLVFVNESSGVAVLSVTRGAAASGVSVVAWRAEVIGETSGVASPLLGGASTASNTVMFQDGERFTRVYVNLTVDTTPQPDRFLRVTLTPQVPGIGAGYVVPATSIAIVTVLANNGEDGEGNPIYAGGSFQFDTNSTAPLRVTEETGVFHLPVVRVGGAFSNVSIVWTVGASCASEFSPSSGAIAFPPGVTSGAISTAVVDDATPEQLRSCVFQLLSVNFSEPSGSATQTVIATGFRRLWFVEIAPNDGIFGVFSMGGPATRDVSEDDVLLNGATFDIDRTVGSVNSVRVLWAVRGPGAPDVPPMAVDFLRSGTPQGVFTSDAGRAESLLPAYNFNGRTAYVALQDGASVSPARLNGNWTFAFRFIQRANNSGYLWGVWGGTSANPQVVAALRSFSNVQGNRLAFEYRSGASGQPTATVYFSYPRPIIGARWTHVAVTREVHSDGNAYHSAYFDGAPMSTSAPQGPIAMPSASEGLESYLGRARDSMPESYYSGLMQDAGFFWTRLSTAEVAELASPAAAADIVPAMGITTFAAGQTGANFTLNAVNDDMPEVDETFHVVLIQAADGGLLGTPTSTELVVTRSDNPNGRFIIANRNVTASEGSTAQFQVSRLDGTLGAVTVSWSVGYCSFCDYSVSSTCQPCTDGSAGDLSATSGTVNFADGQRTANISVGVLQDNRVEFREIFEIDLVGVTNGGRLDSTQAAATLNVPQNGFPYGQFILQVLGSGSARSISANEGDVISFNAIRHGRTYGAVTLDWGVVLGNASSSDVAPLSGTVSLADGQAQAQFSVTVVDDTVPELVETFSVRLPPTSQQSGLAEVDPTPVLTSVAVSVTENDVPYGVYGLVNRSITIDEDGTAVFFVERDLGMLSASNVSWRVVGVNASDQLDQVGGTLEFWVGQRYATITLRPLPDGDAPERSRRFAIVLFAPTAGATISPQSATAILTLASENDPHGVFSIEAVQATYDEPATTPTPIEFRIRRAGGTFGRVDVSYTTVGSTATENEDFVPVQQTVQFAEGEAVRSVFVTLLPNTVPEVLETGYVLLTGAAVVAADSEAPFATGETSPRIALGNGSIAAFEIAPNDFTFGVLHATRVTPQTLSEGGVATFAINRAAGLFGTVDVQWSAPPNGRFTAGDLNRTMGEVRFLPGEAVKYVSVLAVDDDIPETDETFVVGLSVVSQHGAGLVGVGTQTLPGSPPATVGGSPSVSFTILQSDDANGVFEFDVAARRLVEDEPDTGARAVVFLVQRTRGAFGTASVRCRLLNQTQDVSASAGGGVQPVSDAVVFAENVTTGACTFYVLADIFPELEEEYSLRLVDVSANARVTDGAGATASLVVRANDDPFGTFTFATSSVDVTEPANDEPYHATSSAVGPTAQRSILVVRNGGAFGSASVMFRTHPMSGNDLLRDLGAQPNFLDDTAPANNSLLFRIFNPPVTGRLIGNGVVPLVRVTGTRGVQGCLLECALNARCVSLNTGVNGTAGDQAFCELLTVTSSSSTPVNTAYTDFAFYSLRPNRAAIEQTELAMAGVDYANVTTGRIDFAEGQIFGYATLDIFKDNVPELQESFAVDLFAPASGIRSPGMTYVSSPNLGANASVRVNILESDDPYGVVGIVQNASTSTVDESAGAVIRLTLVRSAGVFGTVDVRWVTSHPAGQDFSGARSGVVRFLPGERTKVVEFAVFDDTTPERNETVVFDLQPVSRNVRVDNRSHSVTILANDEVNGNFGFSLNVLSLVLIEPPGSQTSQVVLPVIRRVSTVGAVRLAWVLTGPDAAAQFNATSGYVDFADGDQNAPVTFWLLGDSTPEVRASFQVALSVVSSDDGQAFVNPQRGQATLTVAASDDPYGVFSIAPSAVALRVDESVGRVAIPVVREFGLAGRVRVDFAFVNGTARSPLDFVDSSGSVVFEAGVSTALINATVLDDTLPELDETFTVMLTGATLLSGAPQDGQAPRLGAAVNSTVTVAENDYPYGLLRFSSALVSVDEGATATVTLLRERGVFGSLSVVVTAQFCTGASTTPPCSGGVPAGTEHNAMWADMGDTDFRTSVVTFAAGQSSAQFTVPTTNDTTPEIAEVFFIAVTNPGAASVGSPGAVAVQVAANDDPYGEVSFVDPGTVPAVREGETVSFVLARAGGTFGTADIRFNVTDASGGLAGGVTGTVGVVQFPQGQPTATLALPVTDDTVPELNQSVTVTVYECLGTRCLLPMTVRFVVVANDDPHGVPVLSTRPVSVAEDAGFASVSVTRTRGSFGTLAAAWSVAGSTALPAVTSTTEIFATPVQDNVPFFDAFVPVRPDGRTALSLTNGTHGGGATHYELLKDDFVRVASTQSVTAVAGDSIVVGGWRFVSTASATGATVHRVSGGALQPAYQRAGVYAGVVGFSARGAGCFLFMARSGASPLVCWTASAPWALVQNVTLPAGAATAAVFAAADPADQVTTAHVITSGASGATSIQRFEGNMLLRQVYQVQTQPLQTWVWVSPVLVGTSPSGGVGTYRFQQGRLEGGGIASLVAPSTPLAAVQPVSILGSPFLVGRPANGGAPVLVEITPSAVVERAVTFGRVPTTDTMHVYNGETGEARVVACSRAAGRCTALRFEAVEDDANFAAVSGWVTFAEGETTAEIRVGVIDDTLPEVDQDITVTLGAYEPDGAGAATQSMTLTIEQNDDPFGSIGFVEGNLSTFVSETNETQQLWYVLERRGGTLSPGFVAWSVSPATGDLSPSLGTVSFARGQTVARFAVDLLADDIPELTEVFRIQLSGVQLGPTLDGDRAVATVTVLGNDAVHGDFHFASSQDRHVSEDGGALERFTVLRSGGLVGDVRVYYSTRVPHLTQLTDATPGADYVVLNGSLVIADGESQGFFTLNVTDDAVPEDEEWLTVSIDRVVLLSNHSDSAGQVPTVGSPSSVNVGILANDDASGVIAFRAPSTRRGAEGTSVVLTVERTAGSFGSVDVALRVVFGSASPDDVVLPDDLNVTFEPGETSADVVFTLVNDTLPELDEDFAVVIASVEGGVDGSPPRVGAIDRVDVTIAENDDIRGVLSVRGGVSTAGEGDTVTFNVSRLVGSTGALSFLWRAEAVSGNFTPADLSPGSGSINFADGATEASFSFAVVADGVPEGAERFRIVLTPAGNSVGRWDMVSPVVEVTANENGNGVFEFAADSLVAVETPSGTQPVLVNVSRTVAAFGTVSIDWQIHLCNASACAAPSDLDASQPMSGTIVFGPGETLKPVVVLVSNDNAPEHDEEFNVSISLSPGQAVSGSVNPQRATSRVVIATNDDGDGLFGFDSGSALQVLDEASGPSVTVRVLRQVAQYGQVHVLWELQGANGSVATSDFDVASGSLDFADGVSEANITVRVLDDGTPELTEDFRVVLRTRDPGVGRIQPGAAAVIRVRASNDPLGVFSVASPGGLALADARTDAGQATGIRVLNLTVQRSGGALGAVTARFGVAYTASDARVAAANAGLLSGVCGGGGSLCATTLGVGVQSQTVSVDLPQSMVIGVGDTFTVTLLGVNHSLGASGPSDSPTLASAGTSATLVVAASQADAVVGFVDSALLETTEGSVERIPITRQSTRGSLVINWAVGGTDVAPPQGTLAFADGEATKTISLSVLADGVPELNETFTVQIVDAQSPNTSVLFGVRSRDIRVAASDDPHGVFQIAAGFTSVSVSEGGQVQIALSRDRGAFGAVDVVVNFTSADGLVMGTDYRVLPTTATVNADGSVSVPFVNGQSTANLVVEVPADQTPELAQTLLFQLVGLTHAQDGSMAPPPQLRGRLSGSVTIAESNSPRGVLRMAQATVQVNESVGTVHLLVQRTGGAIGRVTCAWSASPSTGMLPVNSPQSNVDFLQVGGVVVFEDGVRERNISIAIEDDSLPEEDETFVVVLSSAGNGAAIDAQLASTAVTILANDNPAGVIGFTGAAVVVDEGAVVSIPVSRTGGTFGAASARWQIRSRVGSDFTIADVDQSDGVVSFAAGQTSANIVISIIADSVPEVRETFDVVLLSPSAGAALGANTRTAVTITENGDPHGRVGFSCLSRYGGNNANGQGDDSVTLTIDRSGGTIGAVAVRVSTSLSGTTASSSEFVPLNVSVFFQENETSKTVTLVTRALADPAVSKHVVVALDRPVGGARVDEAASTARVTIYATPFTADILSRVQSAVCSLQQVSASAAMAAGEVLTQVEYDAYVNGLRDLASGPHTASSEGQGLIDELFAIVLNPASLGPDVRNNRGLPEVLQGYARARHTQAPSARLARRQAACSDRTTVLRIGSLASVETVTKASASSYNGLRLASDRDEFARHAAQLPSQVYASHLSCAVMTHTTYYTSAAFRTAARSAGSLPTSPLVGGGGYEVLAGRVVSVALDNATARAAMGYGNPIRFAVEYDAASTPAETAVCARWSAELNSNNGAWTTRDCRAASTGAALSTGRGSTVTCECSSVDATHLAVLVPREEDNDTAVSAANQIGFIVLLAATFALIVVYFFCHKDRLETPSVQMVMQLVIAVFLTQFFAIVSANASESATEGGSQAIGILLHFSIAAQFAWACAMCYYLYTEFLLPTNAASIATSPPRFWFYAGAAWGGAAAVVIVYLVGDLGSRGDMAEVYGWARDDKSFSLIPSSNDGGIYGGVCGLMLLAVAAVVCCALRLLCNPESQWLGNDDLFQNRSNREEMRILLGLFALIVLNTSFLLWFVYEDSTAASLMLLIVSIVEALYIMYFYAFTTNVRKGIAGPGGSGKRRDNDIIAMTNPAFDASHEPGHRLYAPGDRVGGFSPGRGDESMFSGFGSPASSSDGGYLDTVPAGGGHISRAALSAGFQTNPASAGPHSASSDAHTRMAAAGAALDETKQVVYSPYTAEEEFDDLIFTLQTDTFAGGGDSTSLQSVDLDATQSSQFAHKRASIMDTHL